MEKLLFSRLIVLSISLISFISYSQETYCVFKSVGNPLLNSTKSIKKGSVLKTNDILNLKTNDTLLIVDNKGNLYQLPNKDSNKKEYAIKEISNYKTTKEVSSFSKKYLSYVWNQFSKKDNTKEHTGVVYRSNLDTLMLNPTDSINIYLPEIEFSWTPNNNNEPTYFLLQEKGDYDYINKIGVTGNNLVLFVDKKVLVPGKEYLWAISNSKYPNLNAIEFHNFKLLDKNTFNVEKSKLEHLITDLKNLGLSKQEIKNILCKDYKLCY
ncbi:hypothetical protein KO494_02400 [Lacinutrix sp. C3R15]|uniref:hypothetical protein n=1 Tax=Flavobacteriaceae TaxID=49546 RepID=UPI001C099E25|nr:MULTISPECIES: hypothetical protein [Flavobacteriaceae]MBU2938381.1 hypothetical protein [Lacinutrix sp. C3R15]MDO6621696.1 hypothetical protein [Oceanihabitans sp. 1_MG-2023]